VLLGVGHALARLGHQDRDGPQGVQPLLPELEGLGREEVHGADHHAVLHDREAHAAADAGTLCGGCTHAVVGLAEVGHEHQLRPFPGASAEPLPDAEGRLQRHPSELWPGVTGLGGEAQPLRPGSTSQQEP
jgi:hypothetical protein